MSILAIILASIALIVSILSLRMAVKAWQATLSHLTGASAGKLSPHPQKNPDEDYLVDITSNGP